jgi:hypothetical protein
MLSSTEGSIIYGQSITPNANVTFAATRGIWTGTGGEINVQFAIQRCSTPDGNAANNQNATQVFTNVPAGVIFPIRVNKVFVANTSANGLVAVY